MTKNYSVAVVGATGAVGEALIDLLQERHFPVEQFYPVASHRSAGDTVLFNNRPVYIEDIATFDFSKVNIALFSAGGDVSAEYAPKAAAAGCVVIDNTSHFRRDADIPLVVPEVNAYAIGDYVKRHIIANPNCSTIQMLVALKPIYDAVGIVRINVATYQAVSGSGKAGIDALAKQTVDVLNGRPASDSCYPAQIAFNVLPEIDTFQENGYTREEMKMVWETQKIFDDDNILVNPTAVRVPVFYGHSEAVHIETREPITAAAACELLRHAPGVELMEDNTYPTPVAQATGHDAVYVGRIRNDISHSHGLNLWVVADNVRKGAALNAVQIAEVLIRDYL